MRFAAIYRPFGDMRLRRRCLYRARRPEPGLAGFGLGLAGFGDFGAPMDPGHSPLDPGSRPPGCASENKCPLPRARLIWLRTSRLAGAAAFSGEYSPGLVLPPAGGGP